MVPFDSVQVMDVNELASFTVKDPMPSHSRAGAEPEKDRLEIETPESERDPALADITGLLQV